MKRFLAALFVFGPLMAPGGAAAEGATARLFLGGDCFSIKEFVLSALARNEGVTLVRLETHNLWIVVEFDDAVVSSLRLVETLNMFGFDPILCDLAECIALRDAADEG